MWLSRARPMGPYYSALLSRLGASPGFEFPKVGKTGASAQTAQNRTPAGRLGWV